MTQETSENVVQVVFDTKLVLRDKEDIKADQNQIRVSLVQIDAAIHANAVQCILHAEKHGDTSLTRRLLVEIIDKKSGYRRQGLIAWIREFTPMELHGEVIKLTGTLNGERRPFRCLEAAQTPFTSLKKSDELVLYKPIFKDNLMSKMERVLKEYRDSVSNTLIENGKVVGPKDHKKPYYDGIRLDDMDNAFDNIESALNNLVTWQDATKDVHTSREMQKKAQISLEHLGQ